MRDLNLHEVTFISGAYKDSYNYKDIVQYSAYGFVFGSIASWSTAFAYGALAGGYAAAMMGAEYIDNQNGISTIFENPT